MDAEYAEAINELLGKPWTDDIISIIASELYADKTNPFSEQLADDLVSLWAVLREVKDEN